MKHIFFVRSFAFLDIAEEFKESCLSWVRKNYPNYVVTQCELEEMGGQWRVGILAVPLQIDLFEDTLPSECNP